MYANRINRIQPSATLEMTAKAAELRSAGKDVINLSVGEPDFPTPKNICDAAIYAMNNGYTKYTPGLGMMELREAVCEKLKRDNHLNYSPNNIIVSCGGKHSLYNACQTLFQQNDEVIIFSPYWVSFPDFISVTGAKPVIVKTNPDEQYEPDFNDLKNKINSNTKGIIINSPSNPTGGVWGDQAMQNIIKIAQDNDLWLFSDECYEQLVNDQDFKSCATFSDYDKIITFQSCSKRYAMTGWRIGYIAGREDLVKGMSKLQGLSTSCPNSIAQYAAIEALTGTQNAITTMKIAFKKRRDFVVERLNNMDGVNCDLPGGAFYVFPDISQLLNKKFENNQINTPNDLSMGLLNQHSIVTVSGESFGSNKNIRLSYATSDEILEDALNKMELFINRLI